MHVHSDIVYYCTTKPVILSKLQIKHMDSAQEVPEFPIAADIALELLMAANFLDC